MKKALLTIESPTYKEIIYDDKTIVIESKESANSSVVNFVTEKDLDNWFKLQVPSWLGIILWAINNRKEEENGSN